MDFLLDSDSEQATDLKLRHLDISGNSLSQPEISVLTLAQAAARLESLLAGETDLSSDRVETILASILDTENLQLKTLNIFTLHRTIIHHISPAVLTAALARLERTDLKIAHRMVGSGALLRAGHL